VQNIYLLPFTATCVTFPSTPWNGFQQALGVLASQVEKPCSRRWQHQNQIHAASACWHFPISGYVVWCCNIQPIVMNLPYHRVSFLGAKIVDRGLCTHISTLISLHTKSFIYLFFELRIHVSKFSQSKTAPSPMWMSLYCCNLSGCAALNVWFTMNGIFVKKNTIYMWREQAKMDWSRRVISIVFCCHSANLCAHAARDFRSQQYIWALSQTISLIYHPTSSVVYALLHLLSDDSHDEYFWTETWASRTRWLFPKLSVCQRYFMVARPRSYMAVTSRLLNNSTFPAFKECLDYTGGTKFPM